ncbi:MAG: hypothetical protein Fur0037_21640 [Planctomycetota bacterium]
MILAGLLGFAVQRYLGLREGLLIGVFLGLIAAPFVPLPEPRCCKIEVPADRD